MTAEILTVDGHRAPPSGFVKRLERFDSGLRVRWGMGQAIPFPGWIVERRIPDRMKKRMDASKVAELRKRNPHWDDSMRYADQVVLDDKGDVILRRAYDMMPDWYEVYRLQGHHGEPIIELGEFVIDFLRKHYEKTLLGMPELAVKEMAAAHDEKERRDVKRKAARLDESAQAVMDHRYEIFHETEAFGGQPSKIFKKETE